MRAVKGAVLVIVPVSILAMMIIITGGTFVQLLLAPEPSLIWLGMVLVSGGYAVGFIWLGVNLARDWYSKLRP